MGTAGKKNESRVDGVKHIPPGSSLSGEDQLAFLGWLADDAKVDDATTGVVAHNPCSLVVALEPSIQADIVCLDLGVAERVAETAGRVQSAERVSVRSTPDLCFETDLVLAGASTGNPDNPVQHVFLQLYPLCVCSFELE